MMNLGFKRIILVSLFLFHCVYPTELLAYNKINATIKILLEERELGPINLDSQTEEQLFIIIEEREVFASGDLENTRIVISSSRLVVDHLDRLYSRNLSNIKDHRIANVYKKAINNLKINSKMPYLLCKNDEGEAISSFKKVKSIRKQIIEITANDKSLSTSPKVINLHKDMLRECRFGPDNYFLLEIYRAIGDEKSYNQLMLSLLEDDQKEYDYIYNGYLIISGNFIAEYLIFLNNINHPFCYLSKQEVKKVAGYIIGKHQEVFDIYNQYYYSNLEQTRDLSSTVTAINSLINVSKWLKEYGLFDLNDQFINQFFKKGSIYQYLLEDGSLSKVQDRLGM